MSNDAGTRLRKYQIQDLIGEGGMGKVYRAVDTELDRPVALKFLPAMFGDDERRLSRFVQEARSASSLNHPNILTVYEIGQTADNACFFATELVDGVTLRQLMEGRRLKLAEVLDVAIQIASALAAAHAAGIVHRDIKPENVMVRRDRIVKVVDFGLAKMAERAALSDEMEAATRALVNTEPGVVMGTVGYMSPEQAAGKEVDARTDIWSLGVVLFEMITGRLPFGGPTPSHVIVSILEKDPPPMSSFAEGVPEALEWIVTEALTKEREERTQTARELVKKLQRVKQRLDAEARIERSVTPHLSHASGSTPGDAVSAAQTAAGAAAGTSAPSAVAPTAPTTSSAEYIVTEIKRHKRGAIAALGVLAVVIAGAGYGFYKLADRSRPAQPLSFASATISRLTTTGKASNVAISPDGKYVVHVQDEGGQQSLWVRQVATQSNVQIVPPAEVSYGSLTFSPDGNYIYYDVWSNTEFPRRALFQLPTLGGAPKKLLENLNGNRISFSPDGRHFAFIRYEEGKEAMLMLAGVDGSGERKLVAHNHPPESIGWPAWSPDGRRIAYAVLSGDSNDSAVFEADVAHGSTQPLTAQRWFRVSHLTWLPDGGGLLMLATPGQSFVYQVWHLPHTKGAPHRLTNDLNNYSSMSLTNDSKTLAVVKSETQAHVWVAPNSDAGRARLMTSGSGTYHREVSVSRDGSKIAYSTSASGNWDIWIINADGSNHKQLTANARNDQFPAVSPDGRSIVFLSDRTGVPHLWRMNIDGTDQRQLTNGATGEINPQFSPDGRYVVYNTVFGKPTVWKVPAEGGEPVQLSEKFSIFPTVSSESKLVAYAFQDAGAAWHMAVTPIEGGPVRDFSLPSTGDGPLRWTPDGRAVAYIDTKAGVSNIIAQPLDGGAPRPLTGFKADRIFWFDFSRDGKQLALSRGTRTSDVILISDFR